MSAIINSAKTIIDDGFGVDPVISQPPWTCIFCRGDKKLCDAGAGDPVC